MSVNALNKYVLDTSALMTLIEKEEGVETVRDLLERVSSKENRNNPEELHHALSKHRRIPLTHRYQGHQDSLRNRPPEDAASLTSPPRNGNLPIQGRSR